MGQASDDLSKRATIDCLKSQIENIDDLSNEYRTEPGDMVFGELAAVFKVLNQLKESMQFEIDLLEGKNVASTDAGAVRSGAHDMGLRHRNVEIEDYVPVS